MDMARPTMKPHDRRCAVATAIESLPAAYAAALAATAAHGDTDARTLAAWEAVETFGATVHRQSRLLAGKSKGG